MKHEPDCMSIVNPAFGEGQTACTCGADLKPAPPPPPDDVQQAMDSMRQYFDDTVHPNESYSVYYQLADDLATLELHITALTRRLAGAEAQLASRERELLDTLNRLVDERGTLRGKAEAAEARVAEVEAQRDKWRDRAISAHFSLHHPRGACQCDRCVEYGKELLRIEFEQAALAGCAEVGRG